MGEIEKDIIIFIIISSLMLISFASLIIFLVNHSKNRTLKAKAEIEIINSTHEKNILKTKLEIQEETLKKISREIHDNISLGLTLAKLQINTFMEKSIIKPEILNSTIDLISKSLVDLNDISKSLDANKLVSQGLINALESEISVINKTGLYTIELDILGTPKYLDSEIDLILLRIFQEACSNIIKHAEATKITVLLTYTEDFLEMKISDNGKGFDVESIKRRNEIRKMSGISNFYARAQLINATVEIYSVINIGTTICLKTPINKL